MSTKNLPFVQRVAILLEIPQMQDDPKEYHTMTQAHTDISYSVELDPDVLATINERLDQFNI